MTKVSNNAEAKYGKEYYESAKKTLKEKDKALGDGDGKYTVKEFQNEFARLNNSVFANSDKLKSQAQGIIDSQSDLFNQYAGKDGVLNADEYCNLINSDEYGKAIDQWRQLSSAMDEDNKGASSYLSNVDECGDKDGVTTTKEFLEYQTTLYKNVFKDNPDLADKAVELANKDYENMKKYADSNGVIDNKAYLNEMDSDEFKENNDKYWLLRDEQDKRTQNNNPIKNFFQSILNMFKEKTDEE